MPEYRIIAKDVKNGTRIVRQSLINAGTYSKHIAQDEANGFAEQQSKKTRREWVGVVEELVSREKK